MNPFHLTATALMIWGLVAHLVADWLLQNDWMAKNKAARRTRERALVHDLGPYPPGAPTQRRERVEWVTVNHWWDRHPAAYVHAGIHAIFLAFVFGWVALPLALAHLIIDTRTPVAWWSRLIHQTQPADPPILDIRQDAHVFLFDPPTYVAVDIGMFVRFWNDQVWHIACIAIAALTVGAL